MSYFESTRLRALLTLLGTAVFLQGCGNTSGPWSQYLQMVRQGVSAGFSTQSVSRDQAAEIPYASLGYRVNNGNQSLLVLATDNSGTQIWTAASHVVLQIKGGRVVRSVGLPRDRAALVAQNGADIPPLAQAIKQPFTSIRRTDLPDMGYYGLALTCTTVNRGRQITSILGVAMSTVRIDETCSSNTPRWAFTDSYWIDADTGFAWRSVQHLHPLRVAVEIEILRPPE